MQIMIVDDSKVMRRIVMRTLRQAGYGHAELVEAADGTEALAAIRQRTPDLVLCDWNMPQMNGIDLLDALRREGNQVKFGFVTTEGSPEMRDRASRAGALFLIAKPFTVDTFKSALHGVVAAAA